MSDPTESLSESQKSCLRLVARGMSSKEIAIETGLSPQTVDTYVKAAMGRLGVANRREAARMLASAEASHNSGSPSRHVATVPDPDKTDAVAIRGREAGRLLPPPIGGRLNELSPAARTYAILRVAVVSAASLLAIALLIAGVLRTFR